MWKVIVTGLPLLVAAIPVIASEPPAPVDERAVDAITAPLFDKMTAGEVKEALNGFFAKSDLLKPKIADLSYLTSQIEGTIAAYGAIHKCELVDERWIGSLGNARVYLCQHDHYLTRWKIDTFKSPSGWQAARIIFDDKFTLGADQ